MFGPIDYVLLAVYLAVLTAIGITTLYNTLGGIRA